MYKIQFKETKRVHVFVFSSGLRSVRHQEGNLKHYEQFLVNRLSKIIKLNIYVGMRVKNIKGSRCKPQHNLCSCFSIKLPANAKMAG